MTGQDALDRSYSGLLGLASADYTRHNPEGSLIPKGQLVTPEEHRLSA